MTSFVNEHILADKKLNMLSTREKTSSCHSTNPSITFSNIIDRKSSLIKTYSCIETNSSHHHNEMNLFITAKQFAELYSNYFERKSSYLPIVDCRSQIDYGCERIRSSHNINCRAKLLAKKLISKRLDEIEPNLSSLIEHSDRIILYDQSTDVRDEEKVRSLPINLVLQAARRSNKKVFIIQGKRAKIISEYLQISDRLGGFDAVKSHFPHLIERTVESPREKHEQDLPPTPDAVDKENFTMTEILPHIFVGRLHDVIDAIFFFILVQKIKNT